MTVTVHIPDELAAHFQQCQEEPAHLLLQDFVLQRFAEGKMSTGQVGKALGLSYYEVQKFLHDHNARPDISDEDQLEDLKNLEKLLGP